MDDRTTSDLFAQSPILAWLPDETLFSLASRLNALWGANDAGRTAMLLFGGRRAGTQHDLPGHLGELERRTQGKLGAAADIALARTSLVFYRRFLSPQLEQRIVGEMCLGQVRHLKYRLGLLTSRFRAHHPLKACAACMEEDRERHGWAYWHVAHQHPGVWACSIHGEPLRESILKSTGVQRFGWCLPALDQLRVVIGSETSARTREQMATVRLAELINAMVADMASGRIDQTRLHMLYQRRLHERALMRSGRFLWSDLSQAFLAYAATLRVIPEMRAFAETPREVEGQLSRLLRTPRSGMHPLWHLVLIDWLFDGYQDFVDHWRNVAESGVEILATEHRGETRAESDPRRAHLLQLLRDEAASIRSAAAAVGVDTSTAMAWAASAGIEIRRRGKLLTAERRTFLETQLRKGVDKVDAAKGAGVSVATVTRTLLTTPGLHEHWQDAREERIRLKHRQTWRRLCARHMGAGTKILRGMGIATYAWLYRNDRDWLRQHTPERQPQGSRGVSAAVWHERDTRLQQAIQQAALQFARDRECKRIYLWMLYQVVPDLRPMLSRLEHLPLTKRSIEQALAWRGPTVFSSSLPFA